MQPTLLLRRSAFSTSSMIRRLSTLLSILLFPVFLMAANFPVTNTNDAGPGSLRQAILDLNAAPGAGPHAIQFSVYGQITIQTSLPAITKANATVDGQNRITINSSGVNGIINPFDIRANNVTVRNFTLTNNGDIDFIVRTNTTGVLIENINTYSNSGNYLNALVYVEGNSTNLTIRNLWSTDIEPCNGSNPYIGKGIYFIGGTQTNLVMDNINLSTQGNTRGCGGVEFRDAPINGWNFTNSKISGFQNAIMLNNTGGPVETANNITLDKVTVDSLWSGIALGFYSNYINTNITIKNSVFDMDVVGTDDDGDYGIRFDNTTNSITLDSIRVNEADIRFIWFNGAASNITINHSKLENTVPGLYGGNHFISFESTVNTLTIKNSILNGDKPGNTTDAGYGIVFPNIANDVTLDSLTFNEFDGDGIYVNNGANTNFQLKNSKFTNNFDGIEFYNNFPRTNVGITNCSFYNSGRTGIVVNMANATSNINLTGDTVVNAASHGIWLYGGSGVSNMTITGCVIHDNAGAGIYNDNPLKVIYNNNSIYNNTGSGISNNGGNCNYRGANRPVLVSSNALGGGQYQLQITIPNISPGALYSVEIYANDPAVTSSSGQYYVTTLNGLSAGTSTQTITYNTGPGATGVGFWTATLRIPANNCGTSEFSDKLNIGVKAPACVNNGILAWYRADMGLNGYTWGDISGNANHMTATGDPDTTSGYVNFNPAMYYDGNDLHLAPASATVTTAYTMMGLGKLEGSLNGRVFSSNGSNKLFGWHGGFENRLYLEAWINPNTTPIANNTRLYSLKRANTGAGPFEFKGNGVLLNSGPSSNGTAWTLSMGGLPGGEFSKVFVPEFFIYNRDLNPGEIQRIESYMALKYGVTLNNGATDYVASDGTTLMWSASANAGYGLHITGIGKDDCTMLHQKQSLSADTGLVTIALGNAIQLSNMANTNAVTTDKTFFVFGDNNGSAKFATAVTGVKVNQRMARVWKVQKSAGWTDQLLTLRFKGAGSSNYLLISTDPAFATISQELPLDASGSISLHSSLFPNGAYYTLGTTLKGPASVNAGVALWLRADDGNATGASWNDFSGNGNGAIQANPARQATVLPTGINFNPALKFNGVNSFLASPSLFTGPGINNVQIYAVAITDAAQNGSMFGEMVSNGQQIHSHVPWTDGILYFDAPYNYRIQGAWGGTFGAPYIWTFLRSPSGMSANRNRSVVATFSGALNNIPGSNAQFGIGAWYDGNGPFNGKIAEMIVYNNSAATTATQRQQIESYLALKYGLTLNLAAPVDYLASDGTTKMWDVTLNNGYNNHITGIGRDSVSALLQKQSVSADAGYVTIALGNSIAASNAANTGTITANKSFLVTGDNDGARMFSVNVTGLPGVNVALARTWKVQKTNWTDQNITIRTDSAFATPQFIIISTDAVFGAGDLALPFTNGVITLNTSQLPNGSFFTFANGLKGPGGVVTGIGAWYKGDYGLSPLQWNDYSGRGMNIPSPAVANRPSVLPNGMNFNPTASFVPPQFFGKGNIVDPSTSILGNGNMNNIAVFGVYSMTAPNNAALFDQMTTNNYPVIASPHTGGLSDFDAPYGWRLTAPWGGSLNKANVWSFTKTVANMSFYRDRNVMASDNNPRDYLPHNGGNYSSNLSVWHGSEYNNGKIPEVIIYKDISTLTPTDRLKIESYLAIKYGVTLNLASTTGYTATDGSVYWDATVNAGYSKHITGIGRDSVTDLNQKQSLSVDTGVVTIALGNTVAASNAANTNIITNDRSFFVFGDDGASAGFLTPVNGQPGITNRMTRIFKVGKTANWADQNITFKVNGGNAQTYLLVSTDAVFDGADTKYVLNADSTVTLNTSNLPAGVYFTFAKDIKGPNGVNKGINFWLRADDGNTSGASWNDYAGRGHQAQQSVVTGQPTTDAKAINFNYGLKFDGTDDFLDINTTRVHPDTSSIFVAASGAGFAAVRDLVSSGAVGSSNGMEFRVTAPANLQFLETNGSSIPYVSGLSTFVDNRPYLFSGTQSNLTNGVKLYQNFRLDNQGTVAMSPATVNLVSIGSRSIAGRGLFWMGNISEVIVYDRVLTDDERQLVESYLGLKYGITLNNGATSYLASNNTVYWTADATYKSRITGIGRDDSTALNTKQSLSADTGFVTLSLGTGVPLTNESNSNTITNNKSFFVFADNGLSVSNFTGPVSGSTHNVTRRFTRVWKVQKTNWADQNITLKIKPLGVDNYLLISTDPNFATLNQELPVANDGTVTLSSALLTDGIYFTFGSPLKSPGGVPGHTLWVRADIGTSSSADNTLISEWSDLSAFSNTLVQSTPANQPLFLDNSASNINFNPVLKFGAPTYSMSGASILKNGTYTGAATFVVNSQVVPQNAVIFSEPAASGTFFNMHATWGDNIVYWDAPYTNRMTYNAGNINNQVNIWAGASDITLATNKQEIFRNGTSVSTGNLNNNYVGQNSQINVASNYNGRLPEIIIYNSALNAQQRQRIHTYLGLKYGITYDNGNTSYLATDGSTIWDAAVNATYKNNIAGIGRDDEEAFRQKQSISINPGTQVMIGLGRIDSTNSANPNNFTADKSYLVWGDDNGALSFRTAVTGTSLVNYRMTRVWRVQKSGTVGNVLIAIPANTLPNPSNSYIIVSNDATIDGTDAFTKVNIVTINNKLYCTATIDLTSGQYFTFATDLKIPGGVVGNTLWLRADYGTAATDNTPLSEWNDFGAEINSALQPTAPNQPVYFNNAGSNTNFNPALRFNGTNNFMDLDITKLPMGATPRTVIALGRPLVIAGTNKYMLSWGQSATSQGTAIGLYATNAGAFVGYGDDVTTPTGFWQLNQSNMLMGVWNGTGTGASIYSKYRQAAAPVIKNWNTTGTVARVGNSSFALTQPEYWNGYTSELIVYPFTLNAGQRLKVETYMAIKYGYTIDQTTANNYHATDSTIIWNATTNATYKYGITGIGRDDLEGLNQKQSGNTDTTRLRIVMGLGSIAETNIDNANSFTADKSYLIWGDDNAAVTFKTTITGNPLVNYRMTRLWTVQKTGTVGQVELAVPYDALPNPRQTYLVVSNDATIDNSDTYIPLYDITINGKRHWAAKTDFTTGQYFTIAAFIKSPGGVGATSLWVRTDHGVLNNTDGTPVDVWVDFGNEVNNASQFTTANQPVYTNNPASNINYNPVMTFNGASQFMKLDSSKLPIGNTARTLIGVGSLNSLAGNRYIVSYGAAGGSQGNGLASVGVNGTGYFVGYNDDVITAAGFWQLNRPNELFGTWAGAGGQASLYSKIASVATPVNKSWNTGTTAGARIGTSAWGGEYWSGPITEVIVFDRALNNTERQKVSTYLSIRNGYTIDQATPYSSYLNTNGTVIWDATANATYKNNIAGIGRDDIEGLLQKQSVSIQPGAILAVGLGTIATDNLANTGNFAKDSSYLIWGSNSTALTTINTNLPVQFSQRLTQQWKVNLSNFDNLLNTVSMEFNLAGITQSGIAASDFNLLIDTDGDGNFTTGIITIIPATTYASGKVNFTNISGLTSGHVITLAIGSQSLRVSPKLVLQGAWNGTSMSTALKTAAVLPATDPYGQHTTPSVAPNASAAAVVDWVLLELRDNTNPSVVVASRAAFVLSNGNVVDTNYTQPVAFQNVTPGSYRLAVRHRNHLGAMTLNAVDFTTGVVDFTNPGTVTWGTNARKDLGGGIMGLWAGDVDGDNYIRHSGKPSDAALVTNAVLTHAGNTSASPTYTGMINVYSPFDLNLDGRVYYTATPSDYSIIVNNVKTHPANTFGLTTFVIKQQLP